jgi:hypothetical protein
MSHALSQTVAHAPRETAPRAPGSSIIRKVAPVARLLQFAAA